MAGRAQAQQRQATAQRRRTALSHAARAAKGRLGALLVTDPEDVAYLTGFTGEDSWLLVGRRWAVLLTDGRYAEQARRECPSLETFVRSGAISEAVEQAARHRRVGRVAIQPESLTMRQWQALGERFGKSRLIGAPDAVVALRQTKDPREVRAIRRAIGVAEKAFRQMFALGRRGFVGRSEREVAAELDYRMRCLGAAGPSFGTIVAAGAHASRPHYRPDGTRIGPDQGVLIDWGAKVNGYCSDLTRVIYTGRIPPKLAEIHEIVVHAQSVGISALRPRVACKTADAAAREYIAQAGYGEQFLHGLGHGVGREVHEAPAVGPRTKTRLRAGMVVTVEPGIYLPGVGGVRIEDDVQITPSGRRRLSTLPRDRSSLTLR